MSLQKRTEEKRRQSARADGEDVPPEQMSMAERVAALNRKFAGGS